LFWYDFQQPILPFPQILRKLSCGVLFCPGVAIGLGWTFAWT
jgi:hypothetical protein